MPTITHGKSVVFHANVKDACLLRVDHVQIGCIFVPGDFIQQQDKASMFQDAQSMFHMSQCDDSNRVGTKRGPGIAKAIGFNLAACHHGKIKTYKHANVPENNRIKIWTTALNHLDTVTRVLKHHMCGAPIRMLRHSITEHVHGIPNMDSMPTFRDTFTSLHVGTNDEVWPHIDEGDLKYSVLTWSSTSGSGLFLVHDLGLRFETKVRFSRTFVPYCISIDMALSNIVKSSQDGTIMFLDTRHRVHGTPPTIAPFGTRYGCAWVTNKRILSTAKNTLRRGELPNWLEELEPKFCKDFKGTSK